MAGTFILGETKVRPGSYFNIQKKGGNSSASVMNGVTAVIFQADFGPLNTAVEMDASDVTRKFLEQDLPQMQSKRQSRVVQKPLSPAV